MCHAAFRVRATINFGNESNHACGSCVPWHMGDGMKISPVAIYRPYNIIYTAVHAMLHVDWE